MSDNRCKYLETKTTGLQVFWREVYRKVIIVFLITERNIASKVARAIVVDNGTSWRRAIASATRTTRRRTGASGAMSRAGDGLSPSAHTGQR